MTLPGQRMGLRRSDVVRTKRDAVLAFFLTTPLMALEFYMGCLSMTYGAWLFAPWDGYSTSTIWSYFEHVIPNENILGAVFFMPGALQATMAFWPGAANWPRVRLAASIILCFVWAMTLAGFVLSEWRGRGVPLMALHLITQVWIASRVGRRHRGISAAI